MPFSASEVIFFLLFHVGKMFPFEDFFLWETKKTGPGNMGVQGGWGEEGLAGFGQKLLNTQLVVGWKSPLLEMEWESLPIPLGRWHWKSLPKKLTEAEHSLSQQCQLVH